MYCFTGLNALRNNNMLAVLVHSAATNIAKPIQQECSMKDNEENHLQSAYYCVECTDFLCEDCFKAHKKTRMTRLHELKPITSQESGRLECKRTFYCPDHAIERMSLYCQDCHQVTCSHCFFMQHKDHSCLTLTEANDKVCRMIKKALFVAHLIKGKITEQLNHAKKNDKPKSVSEGEKNSPEQTKTTKQISSAIEQRKTETTMHVLSDNATNEKINYNVGKVLDITNKFLKVGTFLFKIETPAEIRCSFIKTVLQKINFLVQLYNGGDNKTLIEDEFAPTTEKQLWQKWENDKAMLKQQWHNKEKELQEQWEKEKQALKEQWEKEKEQLLQIQKQLKEENEIQYKQNEEISQKQRVEEIKTQQKYWNDEKIQLQMQWLEEQNKLKTLWADEREQIEQLWKRRCEENEQQWLYERMLQGKHWQEQSLVLSKEWNGSILKFQTDLQQWHNDRAGLMEQLSVIKQDKAGIQEQMNQDKHHQSDLWKRWEHDKQLLVKLHNRQTMQFDKIQQQLQWRDDNQCLFAKERQKILNNLLDRNTNEE